MAATRRLYPTQAGELPDHLGQMIPGNVELPCNFRDSDQCAVLIGSCEIDKDTKANVGVASNAHE